MLFTRFSKVYDQSEITCSGVNRNILLNSVKGGGESA